MPTYQYRCTECGNELEAVQKFSDPSLTVCPECQGELRKAFSAVGVVIRHIQMSVRINKHQILTTSLPMLVPSNNLFSASGAPFNPSTSSIRYLILPSISHLPSSVMHSIARGA